MTRTPSLPSSALLGPFLLAIALLAVPVPAQDGAELVAEAEAGPPPRIVGVQPAISVIPANLRRIYVHFSVPMQGADLYEHIRILDEAGTPVELAFVEVESGLWDPDRRRLTLLIHPGRVKREVGPRVAMGPVLVPGYRYTLTIDPDLTDTYGRPLARGLSWRLWVDAEDRESPDPSTWTLELPESLDDPLLVRFGETLDAVLLPRLLRVEGSDGELVAGKVDAAKDGTAWRFLPDAPWTPGAYALVVDPRLEDLAGNRIDGLFDAEMGRVPGEPSESVRLEFKVPGSDR